MANNAPPAQQLYLITPPLQDEAWAQSLPDVLSAAPIACLLANTSGCNDTDAKKIIRSLTPITQKYNTALLTWNNPQLAVRGDADGCHLTHKDDTSVQELKDAITTLKPQRIIGVGGLKNKHDAMAAGEQDVDYVMFGEPSADGYVAPLEQRLERVQWWADIFNVPCVAYAQNADDITALAQAGADFIALSTYIWAAKDGPASAARHAAERVRRTS